jgi:hypothetical protein
MSEFRKYIESRFFLNAMLQDQIIFNSLKDKFPEILADLTTAKFNSNCTCVKRVIAYLLSKIDVEVDYFNNLFNNEMNEKSLINIEKILKELKKIK